MVIARIDCKVKLRVESENGGKSDSTMVEIKIQCHCRQGHPQGSKLLGDECNSPLKRRLALFLTGCLSSLLSPKLDDTLRLQWIPFLCLFCRLGSCLDVTSWVSDKESAVDHAGGLSVFL